MSNGEVTIDLSNYRDRVGGRVEPGRYRVTVEDAEQSTAKSGNPMITLYLRILDGEESGATLVDRLVLTEGSMFRVVGFLQALGIPTPRKRIKFNLRQFIGRTLEADVDDGEPYMGRVKSEVRGYNKSARADEQVRDLDAGLSEFSNTGSPTGNGQHGSAPADTSALEETVDLETLDL